MATAKARPVMGEQDAGGMRPAKMISISKTSLAGRTEMLDHVLDNMKVNSHAGILLTGSTGIGKTTFVRQLGRLLGMNVEMLEAPHVTEEHLINIPFIVFKPNGTKSRGQLSLDPNNVEVELAQSNLATVLRSYKPITDAQYLDNVRNFNANDMAMYQHMRGTEDAIPAELQEIRQRHRTILFLDEYWRQTSANVRNILRGILNGRIGNDRMPKGVYTIYASNLADVGQTIERTPTNADMLALKFKAPSKDEFFHNLLSTWAKSQKVKLDPMLINGFYKALEDQHISHDDVETEIRTSPRRLEQLMLYINANLPVTTKEQAKALFANVEANFSDETQTSSLHALFDSTLRNILKDMGSPHYQEKANPPTEWRDTLAQQVATQMKLGSARKYIPVVMGEHGIGKTKQMANIAHDLNLRLISIDCSTLSIDDITGTPIPRREVSEADESKLGVQFAEPALLKRIKNEAQEEARAFMQDPDVSDIDKQRWQSQEFQYLLFFDELTRVKSQAVFNSLRRVILDKSFNDQAAIPENMVVVAAMNPSDKGVVELTSHLKDAVDLISTSPSWEKFSEYMANDADAHLGTERFPEQVRKSAAEIVNGFSNQFGLRMEQPGVNRQARRFYIKVTPEETVYISPREYADMYAQLVTGINRAFSRLPPDPAEHENAIHSAVMKKLEMSLDHILENKHQVNSPQFMKAVSTWLASEIPNIMTKHRSNVGSLETMLDEVLAGTVKDLKDHPNIAAYLNNYNRNAFVEQMMDYFAKLGDRELKRYDLWAKDQVNAKTKEQGKMVVVDSLWSKVEAIHNEFVDVAEAYELDNDMIDALDNALLETLDGIMKQIKLPPKLAAEMAERGVQKMIKLKWSR